MQFNWDGIRNKNSWVNWMSRVGFFERWSRISSERRRIESTLLIMQNRRGLHFVDNSRAPVAKINSRHRSESSGERLVLLKLEYENWHTASSTVSLQSVGENWWWEGSKNYSMICINASLSRCSRHGTCDVHLFVCTTQDDSLLPLVKIKSIEANVDELIDTS